MTEQDPTMTAAQHERFEAHLRAYSERIDITPGLRSLLWSLACIELEEEELQKIVSAEGTVYTTKGGIMKQRPEWQQLRDDRQRKTAIVSKLEAQISHEPIEHDPLGDLMHELD